MKPDEKTLREFKEEYKKEFGKSPDRADAFVLTFAVNDTKGFGDVHDDEDDFDSGTRNVRSSIGGY